MAKRKTPISFIGYANNTIYFLISRLRIIIIFLALAGLFYFHRSGNKFLIEFEATIIDKSAPIIGYVSNSINNIIKFSNLIFGVFNAYEENEKLKFQIHQLQVENKLNEKIFLENKELKKIVKFAENNPLHFLTARILVNSNSNYGRSIIISAGEEDGVYEGQIVVNDMGIVGRVIKVNKKSSKVLLIVDDNSRIPVISTKNREKAIVSGNSTNNLILLYLRDDNKLEDGEMLISSGDGELIPYGIPVGVVSKNSQNKIVVKPFVNIDTIEYISVIKNY